MCTDYKLTVNDRRFRNFVLHLLMLIVPRSINSITVIIIHRIHFVIQFINLYICTYIIASKIVL